MSSWIQQKKIFEETRDNIVLKHNVPQLITQLDTAVGNYIAQGGLSQDPNNPNYNTITDLIGKAETIKKNYSDLNNHIITYLKNNATNTNMTGLLTKNGELQGQINRLEKIQKEIKIDVESSLERDKLLRSRDTAVTPHQLFILDRPVRKGLIPYLWIISVLFIGVGLVILKMSMPSLQLDATTNTTSSMYYMIMEFITNKVVIGSLIASALIVILFLSLKVAGVFGK